MVNYPAEFHVLRTFLNGHEEILSYDFLAISEERISYRDYTLTLESRAKNPINFHLDRSEEVVKTWVCISRGAKS